MTGWGEGEGERGGAAKLNAMMPTAKGTGGVDAHSKGEGGRGATAKGEGGEWGRGKGVVHRDRG